MTVETASQRETARSQSIRHEGKSYHDFMSASTADRRVRDRFQRLVFRLMPSHGTILDYGAGTGIDAKSYAARGFRVLVHEPSEANLAYLGNYCRQEIAQGEVSIADLSVAVSADMVVANFAVLNLISDHRSMFGRFAELVRPGGLVLASLLNPLFVGDTRYSWWWENLPALVRRGRYAVVGESGPIHRIAPAAVVRAARPHFVLVERTPSRSWFPVSQYIFMLFRKQ